MKKKYILLLLAIGVRAHAVNSPNQAGESTNVQAQENQTTHDDEKQEEQPATPNFPQTTRNDPKQEEQPATPNFPQTTRNDPKQQGQPVPPFVPSMGQNNPRGPSFGQMFGTPFAPLLPHQIAQFMTAGAFGLSKFMPDFNKFTPASFALNAGPIPGLMPPIPGVIPQSRSRPITQTASQPTAPLKPPSNTQEPPKKTDDAPPKKTPKELKALGPNPSPAESQTGKGKKQAPADIQKPKPPKSQSKKPDQAAQVLEKISQIPTPEPVATKPKNQNTQQPTPLQTITPAPQNLSRKEKIDISQKTDPDVYQLLDNYDTAQQQIQDLLSLNDILKVIEQRKELLKEAIRREPSQHEDQNKKIKKECYLIVGKSIPLNRAQAYQTIIVQLLTTLSKKQSGRVDLTSSDIQRLCDLQEELKTLSALIPTSQAKLYEMYLEKEPDPRKIESIYSASRKAFSHLLRQNHPELLHKKELAGAKCMLDHQLKRQQEAQRLHTNPLIIELLNHPLAPKPLGEEINFLQREQANSIENDLQKAQGEYEKYLNYERVLIKEHLEIFISNPVISKQDALIDQ